MLPEGCELPISSAEDLIRRSQGYVAMGQISLDRGDGVQALDCFAHAFDDGAVASEYYGQIVLAFEMIRREKTKISPRLVRKICDWFPGDNCILNNKALLFDQEGLVLQSVCTFTEILQSTPAEGQIEVINDLENIRTHFFDQWHWIMVNDRRRNRAFFDGIREILTIFKENPMESGSKVNILDLGCGSGLLTVMAAKIAKEIGLDTKFISVDSSNTFGDVAKITCQENEVESEVRTVDSREMKPPYGSMINLVISETLDCAIFGEGICSSLLDVHKRMRSPEKFHVVPQSAKLFVQLISSDTIKRNHHRKTGVCCLISQETYHNSPAPQEAPYDCERMEKIGFERLSDATQVLDIDFEDPNQLEAVVGNVINGEFNVTLTKEGEVVALMAWFFLATGTTACLSTEPGLHMCWPQAVFPIRCHRRLPVGTQIQFQYQIQDEKLFIQPKNLPEPQRPVVRAEIGFDFKALNNDALRGFVSRFVENSTELIVDVSNLAIESSDGKIISKPKSPALQKFVGKSDLDPRQARYLLTWPFSSCGGFDIDEYLVDEETSVSFNYTVFPSKFRFQVQLFSSTELAHQCHMVPAQRRGEEYCGVNLNSMENLNIRYFEEVVLSRIEWTACSDPVMAHEIDLGNIAEVIVPRSQTLELTPHPNSPKSDGILFWIEVLGPSGDMFSFKEHSGDVKAFVFSKPHNVEQKIEAKVDYFGGRLLFTVPDLNEPENQTFYDKFRGVPV